MWCSLNYLVGRATYRTSPWITKIFLQMDRKICLGIPPERVLSFKYHVEYIKQKCERWLTGVKTMAETGVEKWLLVMSKLMYFIFDRLWLLQCRSHNVNDKSAYRMKGCEQFWGALEMHQFQDWDCTNCKDDRIAVNKNKSEIGPGQSLCVGRPTVTIPYMGT